MCSDDERVISASLDRIVKIWSATTGQALGSIRLGRDCWPCIALFPDGKRAVVGSSFSHDVLYVFRIDDGAVLQAFRSWPHMESVLSVVVSRNNRRIASTSQDKSIEIWNVRSG